MRSGGRLGLAALTVVATVAAGVALGRAEPAPRPGPAPARSASGAWFCPHGGGTDWTTDLYVANPTTTAAQIRVTPVSSKRGGDPRTFTVDPGTEIRVPAVSDDEAASSFVESFGGWVAVGWVTHAGGSGAGVAAEPCAPEPGRHWFAADGTTEQGQSANLMVMNPFDVEAVIDVTVLSQTRAPIRDADLTNLRIEPHRSVIVRLNAVSADEAAAAAEVIARTGRIAVASLGRSRDGGIRSAIGVQTASSGALLGGTRDVGQSTLAVMVPQESEVRFGAALLSEEKVEAAGGLATTAQSGPSARAYPLLTQGPSLVDVQAEADGSLVVVRRSEGANGDPGATSGTAEAASAWVVLPTVAGEPNAPGMVLGNSGPTPVEVALTLLGGSGPLGRVTVTVPASSAVGVPVEFLERDPTAAVVAVSTGAPFVAAGASSSLGQEGMAAYAVAAGIVVPEDVPLDL